MLRKEFGKSKFVTERRGEEGIRLYLVYKVLFFNTFTLYLPKIKSI